MSTLIALPDSWLTLQCRFDSLCVFASLLSPGSAHTHLGRRRPGLASSRGHVDPLGGHGVIASFLPRPPGRSILRPLLMLLLLSPAAEGCRAGLWRCIQAVIEGRLRLHLLLLHLLPWQGGLRTCSWCGCNLRLLLLLLAGFLPWQLRSGMLP